MGIASHAIKNDFGQNYSRYPRWCIITLQSGIISFFVITEWPSGPALSSEWAESQVLAWCCLVLSGPWCCHWTGDGAGWRLTGLGGTTGQLLLGGFRGILTLLTLLTPQQYITPSHQSWNYKAPVERRKLFQYFFMKKMWLPWRCSGHSDIAWDLGGIRVELFWDLKYFPSLCHFHEISISCKLTKLLQISII